MNGAVACVVRSDLRRRLDRAREVLDRGDARLPDLPVVHRPLHREAEHVCMAENRDFHEWYVLIRGNCGHRLDDAAVASDERVALE